MKSHIVKRNIYTALIEFCEKIDYESEFWIGHALNTVIVRWGMNLRWNAKYEQYVSEKLIPHKVAVYKAGQDLEKQDWFRQLFDTSIKNRLLLHDLSKFSSQEAGYADYPNIGNAWHHHKMNNDHHPEYWLNPDRSGRIEPLPMPKECVAEMLADWIGASQTYGEALEDWLPKNLHHFVFHPQTAWLLSAALRELNFTTDYKEFNNIAMLTGY